MRDDFAMVVRYEFYSFYSIPDVLPGTLATTVLTVLWYETLHILKAVIEITLRYATTQQKQTVQFS